MGTSRVHRPVMSGLGLHVVHLESMGPSESILQEV